MDDNKLYSQLAQMWQYYASWREKIFAGYLTVLAGLGVFFSQHTRPLARAVAMAASILVSIVFVILDIRDEQFINVCQDAAAALEGKSGGYTALNSLRDRYKTRAGLGVAVRLLAGGVISVSVGALYIYLIDGRADLNATTVTGGILFIISACLLPPVFRWLAARKARTSPHRATGLFDDSTTSKK